MHIDEYKLITSPWHYLLKCVNRGVHLIIAFNKNIAINLKYHSTVSLLIMKNFLIG